MGVHAPLRRQRLRTEIEDEIELHLARVSLLVARLDRMDGDCDLEEDDPLEDNNDDEGWAGEISPLRPRYAVDQSRGPTNEKEGYRAWQRQFFA